MICIDREFSYRGASVRVIVETSNSTICRVILEILECRDFKALELIRTHGGCKILSENPLRVISRDEQIALTLKPVNFLARLSWGMVINEARKHCTY